MVTSGTCSLLLWPIGAILWRNHSLVRCLSCRFSAILVVAISRGSGHRNSNMHMLLAQICSPLPMLKHGLVLNNNYHQTLAYPPIVCFGSSHVRGVRVRVHIPTSGQTQIPQSTLKEFGDFIAGVARRSEDRESNYVLLSLIWPCHGIFEILMRNKMRECRKQLTRPYGQPRALCK